MISEKLKLNFPIAGGDVFDDSNEEIFFSYFGKFSNTTNNLSDLSLSKLESHVPLGYKSILICKRTKLFRHGNTIREFGLSPDGKFILLTNSEYKLYVQNWKREIETTVIYKPNSIDLSISSSIWDDLNECKEYGLKFSEINNCDVLIASVMETINWH